MMHTLPLINEFGLAVRNDPNATYPPDRHHLAGMTRLVRQRLGDARRAT
jgi:hypothetical protein